MPNILRPISEIAYDIQKEWGVKVNYAAKPYLSALKGFDSISDHYGYDSARSIVLYFLGNASTFRGDAAKSLKAELKQHLNQKG